MQKAIVCLAVLAGCAESQTATSQGNAELGIVRFDVVDTDYKTTVTGLDAAGGEVGRLELVHGLFTLSSMFAEDYDTPQIVGRKLDVDVRGELMTWETGGYEPVLQLPPHPDYDGLLPVFLDDAHVKSVLLRWGIAFADPNEGQAEAPYFVYSGSDRGDSPQSCDGVASCGTAFYGTIGMCAGGSASITARRITQHSGTNCGLYSSSYDQVVVNQCCPPDWSGAATNWFGRKACPTTSNNSTVCGTRSSGACKGCPGYPAYDRSCSVSTGAAVGTCGSTVYPISWSYNSCQLFGGRCTVNSDCCNTDPMFCDNGACNFL